MKYNFVFMGLLCLMTFFCTTSCDKEKLEDVPIWLPGDQEFGFAKGKKNGKKFEASAEATFYKVPNENYFYIKLSTFSEEGYSRGSFIIGSGISMYVKKYDTESDDFPFDVEDDIATISYFTSRDDGDIQGDSYRLDTAIEGNYLKITEVDTINNIVKGEFTATLNHKYYSLGADPRSPGVLKFHKVRFEAKIRK